MLIDWKKPMSPDAFLALLVYAFVTSITPGPNNFMLLASGVNFGFCARFRTCWASAVGFLVLLLAVGFGLGAVLTAFPALHTRAEDRRRRLSALSRLEDRHVAFAQRQGRDARRGR